MKTYKDFGAQQAESGALANVLAHLGVTAPHSGKPISEAMLFGIGGGIGLTYFAISMHGKEHLYLGTKFHTKEAEQPEFLLSLCERIGVNVKVQHSSSPKAGQSNLQKALDQGHTPIVWADKGLLPYFGPGQWADGYHTLIVYGIDDTRDEVYVADLPAQGLTLSQEALAKARQNTWAPKFRIMVVEPPALPLGDVRSAVHEGIRTCMGQMTGSLGIGNFGLTALSKWAELLVNTRDKKGWPKLFPTARGLLSVLMSLYGQIETRGTSGGALRFLYADFLQEAGEALGEGALTAAAEHYREAGTLWQALGVALLPDTIPLFGAVRELLARKHRLFLEQGTGAALEVQAICERLGAIKAQVQEGNLLSSEDRNNLLGDIRERVLQIQAVEQRAVTDLSAWLSVKA